ncbi:MAG: twin-arginine translocase subunit TatC [Kiritimatiellia bacterium]|nr:twin-arginine translocase subunit TatC [Kiritimatiellia bacterium]
MLTRFDIRRGDDAFEDPPRPFMEHLMDLRKCLIRCGASWLLGTVLMGFATPLVYRWLTAPFTESAGQTYNVQLTGLELTTGVSIILKIALWGGVAVAFPALVYFIAQFIFPGLKPSERRLIGGTLLTSAILFVGGVAMAYRLTLKVAFEVLIQISQWVGFEVTMLTIDQYITLVLKTIIAFGIAFQMPLLLLILGWLGFVQAATLRRYRRHAIVLILVIAMVLTPPEPVSQILMGIPMYLLYELCILLISLRPSGESEPAASENNQPHGV